MLRGSVESVQVLLYAGMSGFDGARVRETDFRVRNCDGG